MNDILSRIIFGNTVLNYLLAAGSIALAWLVLKVIRIRLLVQIKKVASRTDTRIDDVLIETAEKYLIPYLYLFINYSIITQLTLSPKVARIAEAAMYVISTYYLVRLVNYAIHRIILLYMKRRHETTERISQVNGMLMVLKAIVWSMGIIMLADNLGYNVTTIIAGLGVGGIAIALAAQTILGDLFSYIVIFFDKPFEIGDFITMNGNSGVVEKIGIKTTHIRSLDGQQLILPNSEMVRSVISNFKRLQRKRVVFNLNVVYNTPADKLKRIPAMINNIITQQPEVTFDRCHLAALDNSSIRHEIVYYVESPDYVLFMNTQQRIILSIIEQFEQEHIEFAFPTQTLFVKQDQLESAS